VRSVNALAAALGVADARHGQAVHRVVRGDGDEAAQAELPKRLQRDLPNFMQPQHIHWRAAMPLNPNGKIDRTALQAELNQEFGK
ncbi:MAG: AMP-binding enzyme, partial [Erythrobacteraceae bacterium]